MIHFSTYLSKIDGKGTEQTLRFADPEPQTCKANDKNDPTSTKSTLMVSLSVIQHSRSYHPDIATKAEMRSELNLACPMVQERSAYDYFTEHVTLISDEESILLWLRFSNVGRRIYKLLEFLL